MFFINIINMGVACGPCYPLILHKALATRPVSATITNAARTQPLHHDFFQVSPDGYSQ